jgi:hypothetical protein
MSSRKEQKLEARAERLAREAKLRADAKRQRVLFRVSAVAAVLVVLGIAGIAIASRGNPRSAQASPTPRLRLSPLTRLGRLHSPGPPGPLGPEGLPIPDAPNLASTTTGAQTSPVVDGIQCLGNEQLLFHIHAHLTVFVDGAPRRIPYGVGIAGPQTSQTPVGPYVGGGTCFYWLHTHAADGIIHIESPIQRTFTLGDFFDVWGQKLGPAQVGPSTGAVTAIYNGHVYRGNPRDIPLTAHAQIQLELGAPLVAPVAVTFPAGL